MDEKIEKLIKDGLNKARLEGIKTGALAISANVMKIANDKGNPAQKLLRIKTLCNVAVTGEEFANLRDSDFMRDFIEEISNKQKKPKKKENEDV